MSCHTIWSNRNLDLENWRSDLEGEYPSKDETELVELMYDINAQYLDDERANLNVQLNRPILLIADIGRWNGRFSGYREISSCNIKDCLYSDTEFATWYVDERGDLRCDAIHHDGTNHYLYRVIKDGASDAQVERLLDKIYEGTATRADITRVTRKLGDDIGAVYGWTTKKTA